MIVDCLWRLFARGGPWPVTPWQYVSMGIDVLLLVGLVALWRRYSAPTPDAPPYVRWSGSLFGLGAAAGVIMLLLRFTSDHAWWTGRLEAAASRLVAVVPGSAVRPLPFCRPFVYCAAQSVG
jgi:hypothetical protein